jgi:UDP-glucose:(heptosyl)LPS alpha-1,3-glucosyltransferase
MSQADSPPKLVFSIHDLNTWGGQDRSTLEIARRISKKLPTELYVFTLNDDHPESDWGEDLVVHRVFPKKVKPIFLKQVYYQLLSAINLKALPEFKGEQRPLVHSTGVATTIGDVFQVQFVHTAWKKEKEKLAKKGIHFKEEGNPLKKAYRDLLLNYNLKLEDMVYDQNKKYIAISNEVKKDLMTYFLVPSTNIRVIHHGVDSKVFHPAVSEIEISKRNAIRSEQGVAADDYVFLFVGSFERKGLSYVLEAFSKIQNDKKPYLFVAGSGDIKKFAKLASALGCIDQVKFLGSRKDIEEVYRASDAFVMPTLYEPFGLVILEAMASGLSTIVSKRAGGSELIEDGKSGLLLENPSSSDEIYEKMNKVFTDKDFSKEISAKAKSTAEKRSWDQVSEEYFEFLSELGVKK